MGTATEAIPVVSNGQSAKPNTINLYPERSCDADYEKDKMPLEDDSLSDVVAREVRRAMRENGTAGRSVDTLRRDIGILAILLGMGAQTGMAFYWAGGMSKANDATTKEMEKISSEQAYQRAQLQLLDGQLKEMKGKQDERDRNGKGR